MRTKFSVIFFFVLIFSLFFIIFISVNYLKTESELSLDFKIEEMEKAFKKITKELKSARETKYILLWTKPGNVPFVYLGNGKQGFIDRNCSHTDCYVTADRSLLGDYTKFDVIAFCGPEVVTLPNDLLPSIRSPHQKYVFASIESSDYYPVCSDKLDGFFNWTWTFRLDSEARWGYMVIRDSNNSIIGPRKEMNWMKLEDMNPLSVEVKEKLKKKTKTAAWFVSNCYSRSSRELFVSSLHVELRTNYNLTIDVYGNCGDLSCPRDKEKECDEMLEKDYYFYLSFENSFSEDYVTEKLLHALQYYTIPIVYGAANYTRFMPDGIYLNARELGIQKLAAKMYELINDPEQYSQYFRWRNHYSYHRQSETAETNEYCRFCSMLFEEDLMRRTKVYTHFRKWWDPPDRC